MIGNWILIVYVYAGVFAKGDSVGLTNVDGFGSRDTCIEAGKQLKKLTDNTAKEIRYECIERK